jgi:hypothetical protein
MTRRRFGTTALLVFGLGAVLGGAVSTTARGAQTAPAARGALAAADIRVGAMTSGCSLGRACTGTDGCATDCDDVTSLISGCARCEKGAYVGCSQGQCEPSMMFAGASADEALCPNQLMIPCETFGEMCSIGHTAHRCRCSTVGGMSHPKWICK